MQYNRMRFVPSEGGKNEKRSAYNVQLLLSDQAEMVQDWFIVAFAMIVLPMLFAIFTR